MSEDEVDACTVDSVTKRLSRNWFTAASLANLVLWVSAREIPYVCGQVRDIG